MRHERFMLLKPILLWVDAHDLYNLFDYRVSSQSVVIKPPFATDDMTMFFINSCDADDCKGNLFPNYYSADAKPYLLTISVGILNKYFKSLD